MKLFATATRNKIECICKSHLRQINVDETECTVSSLRGIQTLIAAQKQRILLSRPHWRTKVMHGAPAQNVSTRRSGPRPGVRRDFLSRVRDETSRPRTHPCSATSCTTLLSGRLKHSACCTTNRSKWNLGS